MRFILNSDIIDTDVHPATSLLDFIRRNQNLKGTKEGCREGDCGACIVLIGEMNGKDIEYKNVNSCLVPIGDMNGKHVITIEGLNRLELTNFQTEMVNEGGTQCGFCTPGFIVSFSGYLLANKRYNFDDAIEFLGGNICRCTGYGTIKRAVTNSLNFINASPPVNGENKLNYLCRLNLIPEYIKNIPEILKSLNNEKKVNPLKKNSEVISGGTDILVQRWDELLKKEISLIFKTGDKDNITLENGVCTIKATTTVSEIEESKELNKIIPGLKEFLSLFGSRPIKNRATLGGNINNASPIGDMTNIFLALNSKIILQSEKTKREIFLKDYYKGYKTLDRKNGELISEIIFTIPGKNAKFNFEKVSKRIHLDISSVNSSILIEVKNNQILNTHISAGGIAPIPLYLKGTSLYLTGKDLNKDSIKEAVSIAMQEISPISDARGSAEYKRLLLRQLIYAHFLKLYPDAVRAEELLYA
jgi:xanthine dehydrogenase small subunit